MKTLWMFADRRWLVRTFLCLLLIITAAAALLLAGPTAAAYRTGASGNASARVARFSVTAEEPVLLSEDLILCPEDPEDSVILEVPVRNDSEVAVRYSVSATGFGDVNCSLENGEGVLEPGGDVVTVRAAFSLANDYSAGEQDLSAGKLLLKLVQLDPEEL